MENAYAIANHDAEQSVLGAIFLEPDIIHECTIKPIYFYDIRHQIVFAAMQKLAEQNITIDIVTVTEQLVGQLEAIGGLGFLVELGSAMPTTSNFAHYQAIILQHYERRQQLALLDRTKTATLENAPNEVRESLRQALQALDDLDGDGDNDGHISEILPRLYADMQEDHGEITGAETGFRDLDRMLSGLQRQDLVIVGARPSMGKTALAMNIAQNYALGGLKGNGGPVGVFSIEMPGKGLAKRMIGAGGNIDGNAMRNPQTTFSASDWNKAAMTMAELGKTEMWIWDKSKVTVGHIRKKCQMLSKRYPGEHIVIIIDYLQLITGDPKHKGNRQQEISEISRELKAIARAFNLTIVALAQLSRGVEQRQDKRPMISDLRESGSIEQDADVIMLLYRDDYYDKESESKDMIEIIVAKHRNGAVGTVTLAFKKEYSKFINLDLGQGVK